MNAPKAKFDRAAKKIASMIALLAQGEGTKKAVIDAIVKLEKLERNVEIRADEVAREDAFAQVEALIKSRLAAEESFDTIVRNVRNAEIARLDREIRASKPRVGTYEHELACMAR